MKSKIRASLPVSIGRKIRNIALVILTIGFFLGSPACEALVSGQFRSTHQFLNHRDFLRLSPHSKAAYVEKLRWFFNRMETRMAPGLTGNASLLSLFLSQAEADTADEKFCIVAGFISTRDPASGKCLVALQKYPEGLKNLTCANTDDRPCNPMLFGYADSKGTAVCVSKTIPQMTRECGKKAVQTPQQIAALIAKDRLHFDSFSQEMKKLCPASNKGSECNTMAQFTAKLSPEVLQKAATEVAANATMVSHTSADILANMPKIQTPAPVVVTVKKPEPVAPTATAEPSDADCTNSGAWTTVCTAKSEELACSKRGIDLKKWETDSTSVFDGLGQIRSDKISPVSSARTIQEDWNDSMGTRGDSKKGASGSETSIPDVKYIAEKLIAACKLTDKKQVVRIIGDDGSYTYVCSNAKSGAKFNRDTTSEEEEATINFAGSGKKADRDPFIRLYPSDGDQSAIVESSSSLDPSTGEKSGTSISMLRQEGDAEAFAERLATNSILSQKQAKDRAKTELKDCGKDKECKKEHRRPSALDLTYDVFPRGQCTNAEDTRPFNILRSSIDPRTKKQIFMSCDGQSSAGPFTRQSKDVVTKMGQGKAAGLNLEENGVTLTVAVENSTCRYTADGGTSAIKSEPFTIGVPSTGSGTSGSGKGSQ